MERCHGSRMGEVAEWDLDLGGWGERGIYFRGAGVIGTSTSGGEPKPLMSEKDWLTLRAVATPERSQESDLPE